MEELMTTTEKKTGAALNRAGSNQERGTPPEFISAVERRFGKLGWDLAAIRENRVTKFYFGPDSPYGKDALKEDWSIMTGNLWLNPPFKLIAPWAEKLRRECTHRLGFTFLLTPSSTGANWMQQDVIPYSVVNDLLDRITFVGETISFPKDLTLSVFGFGLVGRMAWHWDNSKTKAYDRVSKAPKVPKPPRISKKILAEYRIAGFEPVGNGFWMPIQQKLTAAPAA
jgi:hypothetical protein